MKKIIILTILLGILNVSLSQAKDTIVIDASKVNTAFLKQGIHRYLVYFKIGSDSSRSKYQMWSRKIDFITYHGKEAISITQEWEDNETIIHKVYSVCDKTSFAPLYQESWSKRGVSKADFINGSFFLRDTLLTEADTVKSKIGILNAFNTALNQFVFNWHLDLEVFPILPYREGVIFKINFYDPGFSNPKYVTYAVKGSAIINGYDNQKIDCWLLSYDAPNNKETFWISKKTHEVLKLEQEFGNKFRYKIKLGFSV